jgi:hypothetical protein
MSLEKDGIKLACKIIVNSVKLIDDSNIYDFISGDGKNLKLDIAHYKTFLPMYYINIKDFKDDKYVLLKKNLKKYFIKNEDVFRMYGITLNKTGDYYCYNGRAIVIINGDSISFLN